MKRIALTLALLAIASPARAQVAGCIGGLLARPGVYFYDQIQRQPGTPAADWQDVITAFAARGVGKNLVANEPIPADAPHYGLRLMFDAGNHPRGRVWVPAAQPIDGAWFGEEHQYIGDNPAWDVPCWKDSRACVWVAWEAGPAYAPRACGTVTPPPVTPQPPAGDSLAAKVRALEDAIASLRNDVDAFKAPRPVTTDEILKALGEGVTFDCQIGRTGPSFLSHGHPCTVTAGRK